VIERLTFDVLLPAATSFVVLAIVFGPLERLFPARAGQRVLRPDLATDVCFFLGQSLAWTAIAVAALGIVHRALGAVLPEHGLVASVRGMHPVLQGVVALLLGDVLVYWFHRACHKYDLLWRFHAVHHSVERLDWVAAHREHPLDGVVTQLCLNLPGMLLGVSFETLGALVVLRGMWAIFIHSNVDLPVGPLRWLLGEPALHHWHHARVRETQHNFANLAPYLDVLFGTYHRPAKEDYELGLVDPWPRGYVAQLVRPFIPTAWVRGWERPRTSPGALASMPSLRRAARSAPAPNARRHAA
jgi:sterol desaturase/sphingolipid hydroxylase (fatty acid hydroxylase superfamily)